MIKYMGAAFFSLDSETSSPVLLTQFITTCEFFASATLSYPLLVDTPRSDHVLVDKLVHHLLLLLVDQSLQQVPSQSLSSKFNHRQQHLESLMVWIDRDSSRLATKHYLILSVMDKSGLILIVKRLASDGGKILHIIRSHTLQQRAQSCFLHLESFC